jgi:2-methylaconitate cis-trans-isomerase PrpF
MISHIAMAEGAPGPTLVLDADRLPGDRDRLSAALGRMRLSLEDAGYGPILKFALVRPSPRPGYDLDYRFVQGLARDPRKFAFDGGCGHSLLAAAATGTVEGPLRVRVLNTGEEAVCERARDGTHTLHLLPGAELPLPRLLPTGRATDALITDEGVLLGSAVRFGNPYLFVDAADLGLYGARALFEAGSAALARLERLRAAARVVLGLPAGSLLPKVAVVSAGRQGRLVARSLTEPGWHPAFALTGLACLAVASAIEGTVPHRLARSAGCGTAPVLVDTPSGTVPVDLETAVAAGGRFRRLRRVGIGGRRVRVLRTDPRLQWRIHATA